MALENQKREYFRVSKIVGNNDDQRSFTVYISGYKNRNTRNNLSKFDKSTKDVIGITLTSQDFSNILSMIYTSIKTLDEYSDMSDVLD